jgi:hypothetical protein
MEKVHFPVGHETGVMILFGIGVKNMNKLKRGNHLSENMYKNLYMKYIA